MSTVVERPMSTMSDTQPPIRRPRREPIEIIDVDSFDQERSSLPLQQPPPQRNLSGRRSNHSETIYLLDSDDEQDAMTSRVLSGHGADRRRSHRQFISPPPLRNPSDNPPPLPTRGWQPVPSTMREPPPVLPNPQPFAFETSPGPPVAGPSNSRNVPSAAAPISRHVPALGFGGALISSNNRAQSMQRQARAAHLAARRRSAVPNAQQADHFFPTVFGDEFFGDDVPPHIRLYLRARTALHQTLGDWGLPNHFKPANNREKEYQQHYTHPDRPEPGFTFDFALPSADDDVARSRLFPPTSIDEPIILDDDDDDDMLPAKATSTSDDKQTSSSGLNALLVCAKCLDPLVLNAGLAPDEAQYRRVWGLRCGHLIDEKCLNELGQPPQQEEVVKDRKGKGKAKASASRASYGDSISEPQPLADVEVSSIRSRLRSRPNAAHSSTNAEASGSSSSSSSLFVDIPTSPPAKRRRGPYKKPKVEAEFEWKCPVSGCGHVHVSVKIDGVWGPETQRDFKGVKRLKGEARGAVAVFA